MTLDCLLSLVKGDHALLHEARRPNRPRLDLSDQPAQFLCHPRIALQQVSKTGPPDDLLLLTRPLWFSSSSSRQRGS